VRPDPALRIERSRRDIAEIGDGASVVPCGGVPASIDAVLGSA